MRRWQAGGGSLSLWERVGVRASSPTAVVLRGTVSVVRAVDIGRRFGPLSYYNGNHPRPLSTVLTTDSVHQRTSDVGGKRTRSLSSLLTTDTVP